MRAGGRDLVFAVRLFEGWEWTGWRTSWDFFLVRRLGCQGLGESGNCHVNWLFIFLTIALVIQLFKP